jgi:hypothetical protein
MEKKHQAYVAYCTVCHKYVFVAPKEEPVKVAAQRHFEETGHTVIVGYEIYREPPQR